MQWKLTPQSWAFTTEREICGDFGITNNRANEAAYVL